MRRARGPHGLTVHDDQLAERERNVARPWGHVNHENVEVVPFVA